MKYLLFVLVLPFSLSAFTQRIVKNRSLMYIEDEYDTVDSLLVANGFSERFIYKSNPDSPKLGESLVRHEEYDKKGKLIQLALGRDILQGKIDLLLTFNQLSDTTWSVVAKYPLHSEELTPGSFSWDTTINGTTTYIPLYKKDIEGNLVIRCVIGPRDENGLASYAKAYDINDSLIEILYSTYNEDQKKEWYDTVSDPYGKVENYHMVNAEVVYRTTDIYNKKGRKLQSSYVTQNLGSTDYVMDYTTYGYDKAGKLIARVEQGEDGSMCIERWYRKDEKLLRYTKDCDLSNDTLNEDRQYDRFGNLIFYGHVSIGMLPESKYSFRWTVSSKGLYLRKEEYYSVKIGFLERYEYK